MPRYNYKCDACDFVAEAFHNFDYADGYDCSLCGAPMRKLFTAPAIQFRGGGWGGNHPGRSYRARAHADAATGEVGSRSVEEIGPAVKPGYKNSKVFKEGT